MSVKDIKKDDVEIIEKFVTQIIPKMDSSTFSLSLNIVREIIKRLDLDMSINHPVNHEHIKLKFDDILFSSKL